MRKKLPIGIEFYEEILKKDYYYVDKTGLIGELLHNGGKVNLFTRPRRFGKTLNMSMLKCFFEIGVDGGLFDGQKIAQERKLCEEYMGKFPVIFLSLKGVDARTFEAAKARLQMQVGTEAERFWFLAKSSRLSENDRKKYRSLTCLREGSYQMTEVVLESSLQTLCYLLSKHYDSQVILLIDEYDVPLDKAFQAGYYDEMISLLRGMFHNALKTNEHLYFAVLTGCLRISKESIFTGLNNLQVHTITDSRYSAYFGFTEAEVQALLQFYGLLDYKDAVREWYDGYRFGDLSVYCPWDVMNYCDALLASPNARPQNYWANTSSNAMVRRFIGKADRKTRSEIESLIAGESIVKTVNQELTYPELDGTIDNLWSVLFTGGYLTQKNCGDDGELELVIPNREIRDLFVKQVKEWFREESQADSGTLKQFCGAFEKGDAATAEELMNAYLWKSISIRDTAARRDQKENFYHGMLLGLLQYESDWDTTSNEESGEGYGDILIRTGNRTGIVIEVKYAGDGDMEKGCREALTQIRTKNYDAVLRRDGMKEILGYGIAFYKKNCRIVLERV